ncbi:hypothetical protein AAG747_21660 [Rapidithrix thailandica]|uniref:Uncharacterized protein n=1 Tax=Rapidithrix thailandica TaxID=413964 RepID=A0AAW9S059_9BACT
MPTIKQDSLKLNTKLFGDPVGDPASWAPRLDEKKHSFSKSYLPDTSAWKAPKSKLWSDESLEWGIGRYEYLQGKEGSLGKARFPENLSLSSWKPESLSGLGQKGVPGFDIGKLAKKQAVPTVPGMGIDSLKEHWENKLPGKETIKPQGLSQQLETATDSLEVVAQAKGQREKINNWVEEGKKTTSLLEEKDIREEALGKVKEMDKLKQAKDKLPALPTPGRIDPTQVQQYVPETEVPMKVKEVKKKGETGYKEFVLKKKQLLSLPDKTFFDLIGGISTGEKLSFHLSPHFGWKAGKRFSLGGGFTLQYTGDKSAPVSLVFGLKTLAKYALKPDRFYLRAETVSLLPEVSYWGEAEESVKQAGHTALLGATYEVALSKLLSVTMSLLYNVNEDLPAPALQSPLIGRLGLKI